MKYLKIVICKIFDFLASLDIMSMFILDSRFAFPSHTSFYNLFSNVLFNLLHLRINFLIKNIFTILFLVFLNTLKLIYTPLIIIIYLSNYRFVQINYSQIGVLNYHLDVMIKKNSIDGYKSIILIPSYSDFAFVKEIFKNLIIVNNLFLNIILLPLKHSSLISCKVKDVDHLVNSNFKLIRSSPSSKINLQYNSLNKGKNQYQFKNSFEIKMKNYFVKNYSNLDISKTFIIHNRESNYKNTSYLRGSKLSSYIPAIKHLLSKGYGVIRLTHSKSNKINIKNKKYLEINTDLNFNKQLQYYLILKSKGFICNSSGPSCIGSLLSVPVLHVNVFGVNTNAVTKKSIFIPKIIKVKNRNLSFRDIVELNYYGGYYLSNAYSNKLHFKAIENTPKEILQGLKEFINLKNQSKQSRKQKQFKFSLPDYIEMKHYESNISKFFLEKNSNYFKSHLKS